MGASPGPRTSRRRASRSPVGARMWLAPWTSGRRHQGRTAPSGRQGGRERLAKLLFQPFANRDGVD